MGNVLTIYNAKEYIYGYVDNEEDFRWMKNHLCSSVEWLQMDRGTITDAEAIASICRRMPEHLHGTVKRFINEYRMVQPPNPAECFFIDDTPANIESAGNLGMDGCVYYGDVKELRSFMRENGIRVNRR